MANTLALVLSGMLPFSFLLSCASESVPDLSANQNKPLLLVLFPLSRRKR